MRHLAALLGLLAVISWVDAQDVGRAVVTGPAGPAREAVPFTAETRYMSIDGFVRWQHHRATGEWLMRTERGIRSTSKAGLPEGQR